MDLANHVPFSFLTSISFFLQGTRQALDRHTEESCQQHLALVSALATRQARQLESLRAAVARLSVNCSGALVWRITDWAAKMAEAKCKDGVELLSPMFYTSQHGYKLQVGSQFLDINVYSRTFCFWRMS